MSKLTDAITDKIRHAVYVEDDTSPVTPVIGTETSPRSVVTSVFLPSTVIMPDDGAVDSVYGYLVSKTDPNRLTLIQRINQLAVPLAPIIADPNLRLRAAMAQSGVSAMAIANDIDKQLVAALDAESTTFNSSKQGRSDEANAADNEASSIQQQIESLQAKHSSLQNKAKSLRDGIAAKDAAFAQAYTRRKNELLKLKETYLNLK